MPYTRHGEPFAAGSETSCDAALKARAFVSKQGLDVYHWLQGRGASGGTRKEAEDDLGMKTQSLCARLKALEDAGAIRKTSEKRDGCVVYAICGRVPQQVGLF